MTAADYLCVGMTRVSVHVHVCICVMEHMGEILLIGLFSPVD